MLVWKGIFSVGFFSVQLQISRRWWHRSAWNFTWWYILVPYRSSPFFWRKYSQGNPKIWNFGPEFFCHLTTNISETVSCSVTCQLERNVSSTRPFSVRLSHRFVSCWHTCFTLVIKDFFSVCNYVDDTYDSCFMFVTLSYAGADLATGGMSDHLSVVCTLVNASKLITIGLWFPPSSSPETLGFLKPTFIQ